MTNFAKLSILELMQQYILIFLFIIASLFCQSSAFAQSDKINGIVIDSISQNGVPYATIFTPNSQHGIITDEDGVFHYQKPTNPISLNISSVGYKKKTVIITPNDSNIIINLIPDGIILQEVIVKKQREKYSKKNNPAVLFVNKIRSRQDLTDPHNNDYYNYDKYEKITLGLNDFTDQAQNSWMFEQFQFLSEYIDTSEISGKPILNVSVKEKASNVFYKKDGNNKKEFITGIKRNGIDEVTDQESLQTFLEDIFREIDLYQNDINILRNRFVSPLSKIAPDFYRFYLTDTVLINDERCIQLSFAPHNSQAFGFVGHIYVPENDSTMFIKKVSMRVSPSINLNFIEHLYINQEFERASNGCRLKTKDDMIIEISVMPNTQGLYVRKNTSYSKHNFDPIPNQDIFKDSRSTIIDDNAYIQDNTYWNQIRTVPITDNENRVGTMLTQLRRVPIYYWTEKAIRILVSGYIHTASKSKFDIGPVNTSISNNDIEGWRFRFGGITTANLNKHIFTGGFIAYGTKDKKLKYNGELEYSFNEKKYHSREFPIHSIKLTHTYDIDQLGQQYAFTNKDNFFLSFKRHEDNLITYHRLTNLEYHLELYNNFSIKATLSHSRQESTPFVTFIDGNGNNYSHYNQSYAQLKLRYAPGEKFYQSKSQRFPINLDAPIIELTQTYSPKGFMGNMFEINKTEISAQKRFWLSAFGYTDIIIKGGHVWSKSPYPNLLLPNANLSYTIQPESFALMNPLEFINDSYASWDLTYWANGLILNHIPLLKKLKLREAFSFRGIWGHLSNHNNPQFDGTLFQFPQFAQPQKMSSTPYMEAGVGLDNILKILRVDYVWRLSYKDSPNIDKHGIRIALHITF